MANRLLVLKGQTEAMSVVIIGYVPPAVCMEAQNVLLNMSVMILCQATSLFFLPLQVKW